MMNKIMYFSASTCGAYIREIHGDDMPADVIEIDESVWQVLLNELSTSPKKMSSGPDGHPLLIDPPPLDAEAQAVVERAWRDRQLIVTDPLVSRHRDEVEEGVPTSITPEQYAGLQAYRRALRNWPEAGEFPFAEHRPTAPSWLSEVIV